jgi:hypothetical protein
MHLVDWIETDEFYFQSFWMKVDESGIQRIASRRIWSRVLLGF